MKLGVLDIGNPIEDTVELAPLCERLGYSRYWIAEHQPQPSPISLAFLVAGQTERIRVGTAGVLLHYYPPLRTAHEFHLLERAFTGRIDAGFCGGITPSPTLTEPDRDGRDLAAVIGSYNDRTRLLVRHLRNTRNAPEFDTATAWGGVGDEPPEIWALGGGGRSTALAAELGLALGYALMFTNSKDEPAAAQAYRDAFVPSRDRPKPIVAVAVAGVCADTDDAARAAAAELTNPHFAARVVGSPSSCAAQLDAIRRRYDADELIFAELTGHQARSLELLAGEALR